ncbi:nucleotide-diphospho-sugar transferase [Hyaloraphidium curvatum]|nr:nucleotide-diphospho-sugar transferase [Hyaloraphidium curvatum]
MGAGARRWALPIAAAAAAALLLLVAAPMHWNAAATTTPPPASLHDAPPRDTATPATAAHSDPPAWPPRHPPGAPLLPNATTAIFASFKYGHLAAHALETALSQTRPFDFIWFADDAAGDCAHLPALYPEVTFILRRERLGTVANFQDLLDRVATERYLFLGADNWLREDLHEKLASADADVVKYDRSIVGDPHGTSEVVKFHAGPELTRAADGWYWNMTFLHSGSMLLRTAAVRAAGGYKGTSRVAGAGVAVQKTAEDQDLYEALRRRNATVVHVPEPLIYYRRHRTNFNPS